MYNIILIGNNINVISIVAGLTKIVALGIAIYVLLKWGQSGKSIYVLHFIRYFVHETFYRN